VPFHRLLETERMMLERIGASTSLG
jgi:hypothetical protein